LLRGRNRARCDGRDARRRAPGDRYLSSRARRLAPAGPFPRHHRAHPVRQGLAALRRAGAPLRRARLRRADPGRARPRRLRGRMVRVRARGARRLRHHRMGRRAAVVNRKSRHHGHVLYGRDPERRGHAQSAASGRDVRHRRAVELLPLLDAPQRRARAALPHLCVSHGGDQPRGARQSGAAYGADRGARISATG